MTAVEKVPTEEAKRPPSLVRKLASVMGASERVAKNGFNKFHNYAYATESDILAAVRAEMATQGVLIVPTIEAVDWEVVETKSGAKERFCTVHMLFTVLDSDSEAKIEMRIIGQGQDGGDKALYKALTGATKYLVLKLFLLPTGDDPEADSPQGEVKQSPKSTKAAKQPESRPTPETIAFDRAAAWLKDVDRLKAYGKTLSDVDQLLGRQLSGSTPTNPEWEKVIAWGKSLKAAADPDEAARLEVQRQAEASMPPAEEKTKPAKLFESLIQKLRDAKTEAEAIHIGAEFAVVEKVLTPGDMKALRRSYVDRIRVLQDASREHPSTGGDVSI